MRTSIRDKAFTAAVYLILTLVGLSMLLPFVHVIAKSFSSNQQVMSGSIGLWPKGFNLNAYRFAFTNTPIASAFQNTVFVTLAGTLLGLAVSSAAGYALSVRTLFMRKAVMYFFVITMLFSGGFIPSFLLIRDLNLLNNLWALILPHLIEVFNLMLIKNYFEGMPEALRESAMVDGANNLVVFTRIMLPMALPIIATMAVFMSVSFWNAYFNAMLYMTSQKTTTLQLFLVNLVKEADKMDSTMDFVVLAESVQAASVVIGTLPILMVYPFMQKYFVVGITVGAVKG